MKDDEQVKLTPISLEKKKRNYAILFGLLAFFVIVYAVTMVKIKIISGA
jgi:hypothetical protein